MGAENLNTGSFEESYRELRIESGWVILLWPK